MSARIAAGGRWLGAALAAAALGCASVVATQEQPALHEQEEGSLLPIAIVPLRPGPTLVSELGKQPAEVESATQRVGRFLAEALAAHGLEVIPPSDVTRSLGGIGAGRDHSPGQIAASASQRFGAGSVLIGQLLRFRSRTGQAVGTTRPASVAFEVTLYTAPEGTPLWTALFDETQQALFDDLGNFFRYPGRGMRWLTVEELSRWGAESVAKAVPIR